MKTVSLLLLCFLALPHVGVASDVTVPDGKQMLFNGQDLHGWEVTLKELGPDPFSVRDGVLHVTGTPTGYIRTVKDYADYKLHVEWRWLVEPSAAGKSRNSGVLLHVTGEDTVWPKCVEGQLKAGNAGYFVFLGGSTSSEIQALNEEAKEGSSPPKRHIRVMKRYPDVEEHPFGEWNSYDIVCKDDTVTLTVNGELANQATGCAPASGKLGVQSEGAPMEFRNIYLEPAP